MFPAFWMLLFLLEFSDLAPYGTNVTRNHTGPRWFQVSRKSWIHVSRLDSKVYFWPNSGRCTENISCLMMSIPGRCYWARRMSQKSKIPAAFSGYHYCIESPSMKFFFETGLWFKDSVAGRMAHIVFSSTGFNLNQSSFSPRSGLKLSRHFQAVRPHQDFSTEWMLNWAIISRQQCIFLLCY